MAFTFHAYPILKPEQQSPFGNLIQNALKNYQEGVKAKYLPKMQEADIFSKEIAPIAALAANPNFTGFNPQTQRMIASRISAHLGGESGFPGNEDYAGGYDQETTPGYASDRDIFQRISEGAASLFSPGGQLKAAKGRVAGAAEQWGVPGISEALGGSQGAEESAAFEQAINEGAKRLEMKGYSPAAARALLEKKPGESMKSYIKRTKPLFVSGSEERERTESDYDSEDKNVAIASNLSKQIMDRTGTDVPETLIFNYISKHPGKINVPKMLRELGVR